MIPIAARATILIERPGFTDVQGSVRYDSWETPGLIKSVDVELVMDETSRARMKFFDPDFTLIDAFSGYTDKVTVSIYFGHDEDLGLPIFEGILTEIGRDRGLTSFTVSDLAFVMKLWKRTGYKNKKDDLAIVRDLVTRNLTPEGGKLQFSPPPSPKNLELHDAMTQDAQTDWEHITERLREAGLHYYVRFDTVYARYPAGYGAPVLTLRPEKQEDLLDGWGFTFHTLAGRDGRPTVVAHRRRGVAGKRAEGKAGQASTTAIAATESGTDPLYSHLTVKKDMPRPSKSKLTARAIAQRELEREHAFDGSYETVLTPGFVRADVLETVRVEGVGRLQSGDYIIEAVKYHFAPGELSRRIELYRDVQGN